MRAIGVRTTTRAIGIMIVASAAIAACAARMPSTRTHGAAASPAPSGLEQIETIVVIYAENRSFDNLYGSFPGAHGMANAANVPQVDHDGTPLPHLPAVRKKDANHRDVVDPRFPTHLPNRPFAIDQPPINLSLAVPTGDLVHQFYENQEQIDDGKNDRFAAVSNAGGLVMGHYDGSQLPMWKWAREYTLADNFFQGAFGGSFLNHQWLICACTPTFPDAPADLHARLDAKGRLVREPDSPKSALVGPPKLGRATMTPAPEDFVVNTTSPPYQPSGIAPAPGGDRRLADPEKHPLPPQTSTTIGDALTRKGVDWAWYAGAWNAAVADGMQPPDVKRNVIYNDDVGSENFQPHHQPFNYFANFAPGTAQRERHLKDYDEFINAIDTGTLPPVTFYKPQGRLSEHAGYTDILSGDRHVAAVVAKLVASRQFARMAIIVTYDENGGWWDHVAPPEADRWGPGTRIPAIIISPFAKGRTIDHTLYDTTSILKLITRRFGLEPLPGVRRGVGDLSAAFTLGR